MILNKNIHINTEDQNKGLWRIVSAKIKDEKGLMKIKRKVANDLGLPIFSNSELLKAYRELIVSGKIKQSDRMERLLRKRAIRTMSGIAPVAILTKPYACPGKCAFCPTEKNVPQSYLSNEPAVMRAIRCKYNPYVQVQDRLRALEANGHEPTKIELIVIGGTWSVLPKKYKYWYLLNAFKAANEFGKNKKPESLNQKIMELKNLLRQEQKKNEKNKYKIIGLTLETRPDYITPEELWEMRELGCTRVELGVQAIDDDILKKNFRGHGVKEIVEATRLLRGYGFKITYHLMPGLPGATPKKDLEMFQTLFSDERFQPDQIKFYPTVVTRGSLLYKWWQQGKYQPYSDQELEWLIIESKKNIPEYVRIIRLIRDIPGESIEAGNRITNLRQVMKDRGVVCRCIRCRENREKKISNYELRVMDYPVSGGREYFLQIASKVASGQDLLFGFCRLFLPDTNCTHLEILNNTSIVRELHVYGELVSVGGKRKTQHAGLGKKLLDEAEKISKKQHRKKIAIISGVGVRGYYRKNGFKLKETYMFKGLS